MFASNTSHAPVPLEFMELPDTSASPTSRRLSDSELPPYEPTVVAPAPTSSDPTGQLPRYEVPAAQGRAETDFGPVERTSKHIRRAPLRRQYTDLPPRKRRLLLAGICIGIAVVLVAVIAGIVRNI